MKKIKLSNLNLVKMKNEELKVIVAGTSLDRMSDNTDVNTTSGDSYCSDNSDASDSHCHDTCTFM